MMRIKFKGIFLFFAFICVFEIGQAPAAEVACIDQICFEKTRQVNGLTLPLKGVGKLKFMGFDMYAGAFYAAANLKTPEEVLGDVPKILILHYTKNIKVKWMTHAAERIIKKNPDVDFEKLKSRMNQINRAYKRVGKGDRYALIYEPGKGTSLYLNEQFVILIPGEDFQVAYFGIWLSNYPAKPAFRDRLLGIQA